MRCPVFSFFNDTATTEIYALSLHDALPSPIPRLCEPAREPLGNMGDHQSRSRVIASLMFPDGNALFSITTRRLADEPAFNFQWSSSSGTVAGMAAGRAGQA